MNAFDRGYAAGMAAQQSGDSAFAEARRAALAQIEAINGPLNRSIDSGVELAEAMWQRRDEAVAYSHGLNAGGFDVREARQAVVLAPSAPSLPRPNRAAVSGDEATRLKARAAEGYSLALIKWGRTSPVTVAAGKARATAESLFALVTMGSSDAVAIFDLRSRLAVESEIADRLLIEGPARKSVSRL